MLITDNGIKEELGNLAKSRGGTELFGFDLDAALLRDFGCVVLQGLLAGLRSQSSRQGTGLDLFPSNGGHELVEQAFVVLGKEVDLKRVCTLKIFKIENQDF